jgi:hypothetical protein
MIDIVLRTFQADTGMTTSEPDRSSSSTAKRLHPAIP